MRTQVAIVGGGLGGLYAARLLHAAEVPFVLLEARDRLGGRVLTVDERGSPAEDGFDLGPSWYWPRMQPDIAAVVAELGLPDFGQNGEVIPLEARIVTAVDVFDALSHSRPYRGAWPLEQIRDEIRRQSGQQFDPEIARALLALDADGGIML